MHILRALLVFLVLTAAMALTPIFLLLLVLMSVAGLLPIPQLRNMLLRAQGVLVQNVGDSLAFVESPIRAALIRTRILQGIQYLNTRCARTIVIAHSQGAAVALDALGSIETERSEETPKDLMPDSLVTFGAGTNLLASLKVLSTERLGEHSVATAIGASVAGVIMLVLLFSNPWQDILKALEMFWQLLEGTIVVFVVGLIVIGFIWLLGKIWRPLKKLEAVGPVILPLLMIAWLTLGIIVAKHDRIPFLPLIMLIAVLALLIYAVVAILSEKTKKLFTVVHAPVGLDHWVDLYSSADPVPNGCTRTDEADEKSKRYIPKEVWNRGSFFTDHTAYWANLV